MCTTKHTYLASRILLGLFGAPVESLCEISITDIVGALFTKECYISE